jgi:hypothetical protein
VERINVSKRSLVILFCCVSLILAGTASVKADILDPADLHVGTGAGTLCATGCGGDPTRVSAGNFDIYYNPNTHSSQLPVGTPFYLILATPVYTGSSSANSINSPAALFSPYSGGVQTGSVTIDNQTSHGVMPTAADSNDIYAFLGYASFANNSFNAGNMVSCDTGVASGGGTKCPNSGLVGGAAPLFGDTITGYTLWTWSIETTSFSPGDLLNFSGTIPIGSYIAAIGINGNTGWAVPFTESGLVTTTTNTPEPGTFSLLGVGLLGLVALGTSRRSFVRS